MPGDSASREPAVRLRNRRAGAGDRGHRGAPAPGRLPFWRRRDQPSGSSGSSPNTSASNTRISVLVVVPGVGGQAGLAAGRGQELLAVEAVLDGDLGQEQAARAVAAHVQAVASDLDLLGAVDDDVRRQHRDLDGHRLQVGDVHGREAGIARRGRGGHLADHAPQRPPPLERADAAAQRAVHVKRDERGAGRVEGRRARRASTVAVAVAVARPCRRSGSARRRARARSAAAVLRPTAFLMFRPAPLEASGRALRTPATSRAAPATSDADAGASARFFFSPGSAAQVVQLPAPIADAVDQLVVAVDHHRRVVRPRGRGQQLGEQRARRRRRRGLAVHDARQQAAPAHVRRDRARRPGRAPSAPTSTSITGSSMTWRRAAGDDEDQRHAQLLVEQVLAVEVDLVLAPRLAVIGHHDDRRVVGEAELADRVDQLLDPRCRRTRSRSRTSPAGPGRPRATSGTPCASCTTSAARTGASTARSVPCARPPGAAVRSPWARCAATRCPCSTRRSSPRPRSTIRRSRG